MPGKQICWSARQNSSKVHNTTRLTDASRRGWRNTALGGTRGSERAMADIVLLAGGVDVCVVRVEFVACLVPPGY